MPKALKDIIGTIGVITPVKSQEFIAQKGKTVGQKFTIYSIGIKLDEYEEWGNIKEHSKEKAEDKLIDHPTNTSFKAGDKVKIYLEAEDEEGKYWKIVSICRERQRESTTTKDFSGINTTNERDKFELGMAKNGACILLSKLLVSDDKGGTNWQDLEKRYKPLVKRLFTLNKELSKECL